MSLSYPTRAEYDQRLAAVRAAMAERSLDLLVVSDPANLYYLTGYDAWSFYTPQALLVGHDRPPVFVARAMDAEGAAFGAGLEPAQVIGYPEALVHRPDRHPFDRVAELIVELGFLPADRAARSARRVAVEADAHFFSVRAYLSLVRWLAPAELVDSAELVNWVRVIKSTWEQDQLRIAGTITRRAMDAAVDAVDVGVRQCDVVAEISGAQIRGTAEHGGDYPSLVPMLPTGAAAGVPHLTWTDARLVAGEATTVELAGVYQRYHAPLARTIMLGPPPDRLRRTAEVVGDGMELVLDALRPGNSAAAVHRSFDDHLTGHGLSKESRIGYSIGIGYPPDWGERTISLRAEEPTELVAGMAFHVILGIWQDDWGYELSEPVIITDTGATKLTDYPTGLVIKDR